MKPLRIGLLGCGTVGSGLVALLERNRETVERRTGLSPQVLRVLVRDPAKKRPVERSRVTTDPEAFFSADGIDVVVELIGGIEPAHTFLLRAIRAGKNVVTANKALLAAHGPEIFSAAREAGVSIGFEASVCGAIPIIRALTGGLVANRIESLLGIVNGTCNFILTRMAEGGLSLEEALEEARGKGLAEADPSMDLDGTDAMQKLMILASLAFGSHPEASHVYSRGIRLIGREDIAAAAEFGYAVRHVVSADPVELRSEPRFLPLTHPLATVREENNAVLVRGDAAGEMLFFGKGAGPMPTAGAVLSDVIDVASRPGPMHLPQPRATEAPAASEVPAPYYLRFPIQDRPGMIGLISTALGNHGISISRASAVLGAPGRGSVRLMVHDVTPAQLQRAMTEIARLPVLTEPPVVIRVQA